MIRRRLWVGYAALSLVLAAVVAVVPASVVGHVAWLTVGLLGTAAVPIGVALHRPASARVWYRLATALLMWVASGTLTGVLGGHGPFAIWLPALLHWTGTAFALAGLLGFSQRHSRDHLIPSLDSLVVTVAMMMLMWAFVALPTWYTGEGLQRWVDASLPYSFALMFGVLYRLGYTAAGGGRRIAQVMASALGLLLGYQSVAHALDLPLVDNTVSWTQAAWLVPLIVAGSFALHPDMQTLTRPTPPRPARPHWVQVVLLFTALVVGPAAVATRLFQGAPVPPVLAGLQYLILTGLVSARMVAMVLRINMQATTDHLTGLPNRRALHRIGPMRLMPGSHHALVMLDLDRFKEVNDSLGHQAGDALLLGVARRLQARIRREDLLVRLGGDEFAVLLDDIDADGADAVASSLVAALEQPFELDQLTVHTGASIGVALFPDHGTDLSTLLRRADAAMYLAKSTGTPIALAGQDSGSDRLLMSEEFRAALASDQLVLHYQPKIELASGTVTGVEALVRWQHPTKGLLPPGAFLPRVEEAGLMRPMTRVVLELALAQAAAWRASGRDLTVAVNLCARSLVEPHLPTEIAGMLAAHQLPSSALEIEITEEFLMVDRDRARSVLTGLRQLGVQVALDDFGTGYSSLAYLRDLPIDELKLDRSFVSPMCEDPRAGALVATAVQLAHSLGMKMVAEGVETGTTFSELRDLGCDVAQGFWMSKPLPADELERWLDAGPSPSGAGDGECAPCVNRALAKTAELAPQPLPHR